MIIDDTVQPQPLPPADDSYSLARGITTHRSRRASSLDTHVYRTASSGIELTALRARRWERRTCSPKIPFLFFQDDPVRSFILLTQNYCYEASFFRSQVYASLYHFVLFSVENRRVKLRGGKNLVSFARKGDYVSSKWKYIGRYSAGRRTFEHGASMNIRLASRADTKSSSCRECKRFDSPLEYSFEASASIVVNLHDLSAWKNNKIIPLYMLFSATARKR